MVHVASEMQRQDFDDPAADRRRDDEPDPHCVAGDAGLLERAGRARRRRQPRRRRDLEVAVRRRSTRRVPRRPRRRVPTGHRGARARRGRTQSRVSIDDARANGGWFTFDDSTVTAPTFTGARTFDQIDLADLVPYIDWTPFFHTWGLRGRYPTILTDAEFGEAARPLFDDAQRMLERIVAERWFVPKAVVGFWQAERDGDDIVLPQRGSATARSAATAEATRRQAEPVDQRFRRAARVQASRITSAPSR